MTERILIVDDIATNRIVLKVKLASAFYDTLQAATGAEAIAIARQARPDLILLEVELPDMDGAEVCAKLKNDPATRDIPVVMVTGRQDHARRIEALRAGAAEVFWKPVDDSLLLARLRSLIRARDCEAQGQFIDTASSVSAFDEAATGYTPPGHIAIVAPPRAAGRSLRDELVRTTADRFTLIDNTAAIGLSANGPVPDVFLVVADPGRPETTLRLLSDLRSRPATRHCAICLLVPRLAGSVAAIALDLGADDLIDDAAAPAEIALRLSAQMSRQRRADRLRHSVADGLRLAMTDPLTGLHNRRYALPKLEALDKAARANGRCYALMLLDLDRFKTINDSLGHAAGDAVLVEVAERLRANLRPGDIAARFGGEEFVIAAPDMSLASARAMAERIRHTIEEGPVLLADGRHVRVTLSIGLAMGGAPLPAPGIGDLIEAADRALLRAKTRGRNQVTIGRDAA